MEFDDEFIFFFGEVATFEVRTEVVDPPETATLAAPEETGGFGERAPAPFTVSSNVRYEPVIFFFGPCSFVCVSFLTTRGPSHNFKFDDHNTAINTQCVKSHTLEIGLSLIGLDWIGLLYFSMTW